MTAEGGIDEWIHQFPALQEIDEEYAWFRPALEEIGLGLVGEVGWGVKTRVAVGASTSIVDLGTDIFVCYMFWKDQRHSFFQVTLLSIVFSMFMQLIVITVQHWKRGVKTIIFEALPVLTGLKPALDAYRIAKGVKYKAGTVISTRMELIFMRGEIRQGQRV